MARSAVNQAHYPSLSTENFVIQADAFLTVISNSISTVFDTQRVPISATMFIQSKRHKPSDRIWQTTLTSDWPRLNSCCELTTSRFETCQCDFYRRSMNSKRQIPLLVKTDQTNSIVIIRRLILNQLCDKIIRCWCIKK